tara:strand:+ start:2051 stop:3010 length:960 start_codon:yes stop_codon:yes gene_type:complete
MWQKFPALRTKVFEPETVKTLNGYLPMGVELETQVVSSCDCEDCYEGDDDYRCTDERDDILYEVMRDIHNNLVCDSATFDQWRQLVIAKYDGSLNYGIEFVTQPMTVEAHKDLNWVKQLAHRGLYSYSSDNCGLHVHIPKAFFNTKTLWMFLALHEQFISRIENRSLFEFIAQRRDRGYAKWQMPESHGYYATNKLNVAVNKNMVNDRSSMINLHPSYTIELRYFKGNMKPEGLYSYLEFIQAMYDFVNVVDKAVPPIVMQRVKEDWVQHFMQFVYTNNEYYPNFSQKMLNTRKWGVNSGFINLELTEKEVISNGRRVS